MGLCQSQEEVERLAMEERTRKIDQDLSETREANQRVIKLLLLGASDCGKSTILKQMKILHSDGFSIGEKLFHREAVYNNTINGMVTLLQGMFQLSLHFRVPNFQWSQDLFNEILNKGEESEHPSVEVVQAIKTLWANKYVREAVKFGEKFQLQESCTYFFDNIDRITEHDYMPTDQDILMTRVKTTGIIEMKFHIKSADFRIFDVGGQRSERKKWLHCFENVHGVIFISAISEFDQVLAEDETTNRLCESLRLFESICNSRWFVCASMIVFMNKIDLFMEKIRRKSVRVIFPNYRGTGTYEDQISYLEAKYEALNANIEKNLYTHKTCATNTNQVRLILDDVVDMVAQKNLQRFGMN